MFRHSSSFSNQKLMKSSLIPFIPSPHFNLSVNAGNSHSNYKLFKYNKAFPDLGLPNLCFPSAQTLHWPPSLFPDLSTGATSSMRPSPTTWVTRYSPSQTLVCFLLSSYETCSLFDFLSVFLIKLQSPWQEGWHLSCSSLYS